MFEHSPIQLYWIVHLTITAVMFLRNVATGSYFDKSHGDRDPDEPVKIYQFRKRLTLYYFFGLMFTIWLIWHVMWTCFGWPTGDRYDSTLNYFAGAVSSPTESWAAMLALLLYDFHLCRRYYESLSVSILTMRQPLNLLVKLDSMVMPMAMALSIVAEAPFSLGDVSCFSIWSYLNLRTLIALPVFFWASRLQHQCFVKLSKLRKNRAGHVVTSAYKMPKGDWFDVVSSPHYFAEILIYLAIAVLLGSKGVTWCWVTAYVVLSHVYCAHSTHAWYVQKFEGFPSDMNKLIPYLY